MQSDPRIGMAIWLAIAGAALLWLLAQWPAGEALWGVFGDLTHAISFISIFLLLAGSAVALLFHRFWRVRADLLSGRDVIARWTVSLDQFLTFSQVANARDRSEKQWALLMVLFFIVVIFGAFGLFDPSVAPAMLGMALVVIIIMILAFLLGQRVQRRQMQPRSREVIVGTRGLMVNGVLHVWSAPLTWLSEVSKDPGPPPTLVVTYAFLGRAGPQYVSVMLPLPARDSELGDTIVDRLGRHRGGRRRRPGRFGRKRGKQVDSRQGETGRTGRL
jgi:hypothetical protein